MSNLTVSGTPPRAAIAATASASNVGVVVLWMAGMLVSGCAMAVSVRVLIRTLNIFEIISLRSVTGLAILLALLAARPALRPSLAPRQMGLHALRNTVHFTCNFGWTYCVTALPLATVFALDFTAPAWVALLAVIFLREQMTVARLGSVVLGTLGVIVILRPGIETFQPAALAMLATAFGFAVTSAITKKLTATVSTFAILFWMSAIQLPLALAGSDPLFILKLTGDQILAALAYGVGGLGSHYCLTNAFRSADATVVIPLDFMRLPAIALIGWALYNERIDIFVFLGAGIVICGVLWNLHAEARRNRLIAQAVAEAP